MDDSPTLLAAFGAGFCSLVSPGVAPLLPAFAGFLRNRGPWQLIAFLCGFSLVFVALGASATTPGRALLEQFAVFEAAAGVLLIAIGLRGFGLRGLTRSASGNTGIEPVTPVTLIVAFLAGAALIFGWTPIAGVVLARILALATSDETIGAGVTLLLAYAAGRALSLLTLGLAYYGVLRAAFPSSRHARLVDAISGALVTISGLLIVVHAFPFIAAALADFLPLF